MSGFFKRWWWAFLSVAIVAGYCRLTFDVDVLNLLPPDEPTVMGLKLYQKHFTNSRELLVAVRSPDSEKAERLTKSLADRLRAETNLVTAVSWQPPWTEHPEQMAELIGCLWFNQPPEIFGALTNRLAPEKLTSILDETKEALATSMSPLDVARKSIDPYDLLNVPALNELSGSLSMEQGGKMFASAGGNFRVIFVTASRDLSSYRDCESWLGAIRKVVAQEQERGSKQDWDGAVIHYTGRPVFVVEIASAMQRDMAGSVVGTSLIIAVLFWLTHRRLLPMLWLMTLLGLILFGTVGLASLILGPISVVSMGFAAVLLGLAVDYAVVHYQEALAHPKLSVPEIRRAIAPSILWAAITTMSAFLVLNFGGLPGLAQLGTMVAIGVGLAAWVMVMIYLPPLFPTRRVLPAGYAHPAWWSYFVPPKEGESLNSAPAKKGGNIRAFLLTVLILGVGAVILVIHPPKLDRSGNALRMQRGEAEATIEEITSEMGVPPESMWLVVRGRDESEVAKRLDAAEVLLREARSNNVIGSFLVPSVLWPHPEYQASNRTAAAILSSRVPAFKEAALTNGFTTNAVILAEEAGRAWKRAAAETKVVWPTNEASQWLLKRFVARTPDQWLMMGVIYPVATNAQSAALRQLSAQLAQHDAFLSGWDLLGSTTLKRVQGRMWQLVVPMVILVLASLWFAFRRPTEIALGMAVLLLSGVVLLTVMSIVGWSWNLLNLMGVPLILGTGVDYSIFMQLALRRHGGDRSVVHRSVGRALLLCGATAIAGFGSLALSSNPGMASLGKVCAVGIGANMLIAVFLLPVWWDAARRHACPKP